MKRSSIWKGSLGVLGLFSAGEYLLARFFVRRTLLRQKAANERTKRLAGTNWDSYLAKIQRDREALLEMPHEDVFITAKDGLKLHAVYFDNEGSAAAEKSAKEAPPDAAQEAGKPKRAVICFHGYTSSGLKDYSSLALFYNSLGFSLFLVDERAHGESEGTYIGFGCLDRYDALCWIKEAVRRLGPDCALLLHGVSMGAATVLMTTGFRLPVQVKAAVSDCAFTSAREVFASVLRNTYHLPPEPLLTIADRIAQREAGYGLNACNARDEVRKTEIPVLFVHGEADSFVPFSMAQQLYAACRAPYKDFLAVPGAGHAESYYKDPALYEEKVKLLLSASGFSGFLHV